ncbi:uncharacterized protein OCT59_013774 [Rhizophagus irregularis]|uniref:Uncharacterized protein n=1 Tax=Rhizophagus irregularis (strain DAOM 197198w) TaxID=1432141 RepID=A0A015K8W5_RHIIW|nr:hypothetical protein RirG_037000 [Rhizophagus irregularis DAOM 197198w]UZO21378.1 hypothetical protein OCT59_013774 [Rhizophagus irregularis]GBC23419.1 hypothetical protein RIR_jg20060.t1 [Rhizophagus irregularis DAOM 181602=DAOM 197198]
MKIALFLIFLTLLTTFTITTATPAPFPELLDKRTSPVVEILMLVVVQSALIKLAEPIVIASVIALNHKI